MASGTVNDENRFIMHVNTLAYIRHTCDESGDFSSFFFPSFFFAAPLIVRLTVRTFAYIDREREGSEFYPRFC